MFHLHFVYEELEKHVRCKVSLHHCKETLHFYNRVKLYLVDSYCFVILARIMKYDCQQFNS